MTSPIAAVSLQSFAEESKAYDALVVVAPSPIDVEVKALGSAIGAAIESALRADLALGRASKTPFVVAAEAAPGGRLVLAPMNTLKADIDDARLVGEATFAAVARAVDAGAKRPLVFVAFPDLPRYARALDVASLAALATRWAPLEAREAGKAPPRAESIGVVGLTTARAVELAALEIGRSLARDITGTEPERMAPRRAAALCAEAFANTGVEVTVENDVSGYPLLAAVARASHVVERHRACVVRLDYKPKGDIRHTVILAGKGVTYDTGGADLKTNGHMAGMSRDKGGAGSVAGLVRAAAALAVPGVRVIGLCGFVRNSIGEESFVSDEIIAARSGIRVRIGNTDAEGRLVLADLLAAGSEIAKGAPSPILFSIATLTGHVYRAHGPYIGMLGNGAARARGDIERIDALGELWAEPFEESRPRREDYAMVAARGPAEDVVSANRLASVDTPRGHQFPFAFIDIASGLKVTDLPFIHLDIGGAAIDPPDWQFGRPTATPISTLIDYLKQLGG